jgi:hypothetical protein
MIKNQEKLLAYQKDWNGVRGLQNRIQALLNAPLTGIGGFVPHGLRDISHNIVLLFGFSVLEDVLKQLRDEDQFNEKSNMVGKLMFASRDFISWSDFELINEAREKRNDIAHDQKIIYRDDCWKYIDAIETELVSWGIIKRQKVFRH